MVSYECQSVTYIIISFFVVFLGKKNTVLMLLNKNKLNGPVSTTTPSLFYKESNCW